MKTVFERSKIINEENDNNTALKLKISDLEEMLNTVKEKQAKNDLIIKVGAIAAAVAAVAAIIGLFL